MQGDGNFFESFTFFNIKIKFTVIDNLLQTGQYVGQKRKKYCRTGIEK